MTAHNLLTIRFEIMSAVPVFYLQDGRGSKGFPAASVSEW
jgi:hypothetical protein